MNRKIGLVALAAYIATVWVANLLVRRVHSVRWSDPMLDPLVASFQQEAAEYRHIGDTMQSEGSRVLEWAEKVWQGTKLEMPYEVQMAMYGLRDAIDQWTHARIGYATSGPTKEKQA